MSKEKSIKEIIESIEESLSPVETFVVCLIKPGAYEKRDEILKIFRNSELNVVYQTSQLIPEFFIKKLYFGDDEVIINATIRHFTSGLSEIVIIKGGKDLVYKILNISGLETDPLFCAPSTIRYIYGEHTSEELGKGLRYYKNAIHRPKHEKEATRDIELFKEL